MGMLPRVPALLRDIASQFRTRIRYIPSDQLFENDIELHMGVTKNRQLMHLMGCQWALYGSYDDRVIKSGHLFIKVAKGLTAREWSETDPWIAWLEPTRYLLMNPPKLKIRPFPGETFELRLTLPRNEVVRIPYYPTEIRR